MRSQAALMGAAARARCFGVYLAIAATAGALALTACGNPPTTAEQTQTAAAGVATTTPSAATAVPSASPTIVPSAPATNVPTATPQTGIAVLPTPRSQSDTMLLGGDLWVDARPAAGEVLALINGQQCGRGQSGRIPSEPPSPIPFFLIRIASDSEQSGCGTPGAVITITIAGRAVNDTIEWQPGFQQPVSLIAGPAFGNYYGALQIDGIPPPFKVLPYVDGTVCGEDLSTMAIAGTKRAYHVVVDPDELRPGCGRAGVDVTLRLKIAGQPDIVLDTVRWETGAALQRPSVDLSGRIPTTPLATTTASQ